MILDGPACTDARPTAGAHDDRFAALYAELRRLARRETERLGAQAPLGTTTLVHETYLDIAGRAGLDFPDRARFLAYVARAMRGIVIDRLRAAGAAKRGAADITVLDTATAEELQAPETLVQVGAALDELAALEPELAHVVDLRFFCGFTMAEIAQQLGQSERTVHRQWSRARALLFAALEEQAR